MSDKKCYSTNNEDFTYDELDDAIESAIDGSMVPIGGIVTVYEGDGEYSYHVREIFPT